MKLTKEIIRQCSKVKLSKADYLIISLILKKILECRRD